MHLSDWLLLIMISSCPLPLVYLLLAEILRPHQLKRVDPREARPRSRAETRRIVA
jgi:hypothetical protein